MAQGKKEAPKTPKEASALDLETQFEFYGQYHTQKVNVAIHIFCVPTIFFTTLILVHGLPFFPYTTLPFTVPIPSAIQPVLGYSKEWVPNMASLTALGYATYFVTLEPVAGAIYWPFLMALGQWSNVLYDLGSVDVPLIDKAVPTMTLAWLGFAVSWVAQFIGHGVFEKRAPALFESLFQSLVLAVFFVWMECLFMIGYRPALHRRLQNRIGKAVLKFRQQDRKAKAAGGGVSVGSGGAVHEKVPWRG